MKTTRRDFLVRSIGVLGASALLPACVVNETRHGTLLSAFEDARGDQYVGGLSLERGEVFGAQVPMRAHGCTLDPRDPARVLFFARRPGTLVFELDLDRQRARTLLETGEGRHLSGHGVFSADGAVLFTPEHDYEHMRGVIAVRDARTWNIVNEIDTRGIDPHEIAWLPGARHLLVANGGIMTHPRTFRRKLNIDTMDPSLCVIDTHSGECLEQWRLADHLLSIRHLSIDNDGTAAVGLQYEGERTQAPGIVALYEPRKGMRLLELPEPEQSAGYVASVCMNLEVVAAACPYGSGIARWSRKSGEFLGFIPADETYGLSRLADGSLCASQRDGRAFEIDKVRPRSHFVKVASEKPIRWDDHWVAVT
jgi:hypothetical protein